jgi:hypothetical protein
MIRFIITFISDAKAGLTIPHRKPHTPRNSDQHKDNAHHFRRSRRRAWMEIWNACASQSSGLGVTERDLRNVAAEST